MYRTVPHELSSEYGEAPGLYADIAREDRENFDRIGDLAAESLEGLSALVREKVPSALVAIGRYGLEDGIFVWDSEDGLDLVLLAAVVKD